MQNLIAQCIKMAPVYAIAAGIVVRNEYEARLTERQKEIIYATLMTILAVLWLTVQRLYSWGMEVAIPWVKKQWRIQCEDWKTFHVAVKYGPESQMAEIRNSIVRQDRLIEEIHQMAAAL